MPVYIDEETKIEVSYSSFCDYLPHSAIFESLLRACSIYNAGAQPPLPVVKRVLVTDSASPIEILLIGSGGKVRTLHFSLASLLSGAARHSSIKQKGLFIAPQYEISLSRYIYAHLLIESALSLAYGTDVRVELLNPPAAYPDALGYLFSDGADALFFIVLLSDDLWLCHLPFPKEGLSEAKAFGAAVLPYNIDEIAKFLSSKASPLQSIQLHEALQSAVEPFANLWAAALDKHEIKGSWRGAPYILAHKHKEKVIADMVLVGDAAMREIGALSLTHYSFLPPHPYFLAHTEFPSVFTTQTDALEATFRNAIAIDLLKYVEERYANFLINVSNKDEESALFLRLTETADGAQLFVDFLLKLNIKGDELLHVSLKETHWMREEDSHQILKQETKNLHFILSTAISTTFLEYSPDATPWAKVISLAAEASF